MTPKAKIGDVQIIENNWQEKHLKSINFNYLKSEYYEETIVFFLDVYTKKKNWSNLLELNIFTVKEILRLLDIKQILFSSELEVQGRGSDLILNFVLKIMPLLTYQDLAAINT